MNALACPRHWYQGDINAKSKSASNSAPCLPFSGPCHSLSHIHRKGILPMVCIEGGNAPVASEPSLLPPAFILCLGTLLLYIGYYALITVCCPDPSCPEVLEILRQKTRDTLGEREGITDSIFSAAGQSRCSGRIITRSIVLARCLRVLKMADCSPTLCHVKRALPALTGH